MGIYAEGLGIAIRRADDANSSIVKPPALQATEWNDPTDPGALGTFWNAGVSDYTGIGRQGLSCNESSAGQGFAFAFVPGIVERQPRTIRYHLTASNLGITTPFDVHVIATQFYEEDFPVSATSSDIPPGYFTDFGWTVMATHTAAGLATAGSGAITMPNLYAEWPYLTPSYPYGDGPTWEFGVTEFGQVAGYSGVTDPVVWGGTVDGELAVTGSFTWSSRRLAVAVVDDHWLSGATLPTSSSGGRFARLQLDPWTYELPAAGGSYGWGALL